MEKKVALINLVKTNKLQKKRGRPAKSQNATQSISQSSQLKRLNKKNKMAKNVMQWLDTGNQEEIFNDQSKKLCGNMRKIFTI